jgi:hypothetical protein
MAGRLAPPGLVARGGPIRAFGVTCAIAAIAVLGALLVLAPVRRGDLRAVAGARFAGAATTDGAPTRLCTVTAVAHAAILPFGPWRIARSAKGAGAPRGDRVAICSVRTATPETAPLARPSAEGAAAEVAAPGPDNETGAPAHGPPTPPP